MSKVKMQYKIHQCHYATVRQQNAALSSSGIKHTFNHFITAKDNKIDFLPFKKCLNQTWM